MFSCEFFQIFTEQIFTEHLWANASAMRMLKELSNDFIQVGTSHGSSADSII